MDNPDYSFRDSSEDIKSAAQIPDTAQTLSPTYRLAFADDDFLCQRALRPVRLQLELLKPEMALDAAGITSTVVLFGGARIKAPSAGDTANGPGRFYDVAREFAHKITLRSLALGGHDEVIVTGGGPGVMEAGSRGAADAGGKSIGFSIVLPHEQVPNEYVTPELCFNFHYFAIRKMHFLMRACAIAIFPGGFGTLDEMFESLTLIQTGRMRQVPFLLFGGDFWRNIINWDALVEAGTIAADDLKLFRFVDTADEAIAAIDDWPGKGEKRGAIPGR